jgi:hypothetical protein
MELMWSLDTKIDPYSCFLGRFCQARNGLTKDDKQIPRLPGSASTADLKSMN